MKTDKKIPKFFSFLNSKLKTSPKEIYGYIRTHRFQILTALIACNIFVILGAMVYKMVAQSWLSIETYGLGFLWNSVWTPIPPTPGESPSFGALPLIWGTLVTSGMALLLAVPISLGIGLALSEFSPKRFNYVVSFFVELLAAIPSVVYGLWGLYILIPFLQHYGLVRGPSVFVAGVILAIMIIPTVAAISRDVLAAVPNSQREAITALGATRWETSRVVVSYARSGVIGSIILGFGRAVGETMAVTMVIGNNFNLFTSLFDPGYTLSSIIANEFREASSPPVYISALIEVGLVLFVMALIINALARLIIWRTLKTVRGAEAV